MKSLVFLLCAFVALPAAAETIAAPSMTYEAPASVFYDGAWEAAAGISVMFSPFVATHNRSTVDYSLAVVDAGLMLTDVHDAGFLSGNVELVGELFGGGVFEGKGTYLTGFTLWGRYNFVQPGWKLVPYAQLGAGGSLSDIDGELLGNRFCFNLDVAAGARYYLRPKLALNAEFRFQHLSNANTSDHNVGVNAAGALLGVSWFY